MANKLTLNMFVDKANTVHCDKYDYSLSKYINSQTKIIIICPIHGVFTQKPNGHLDGKGCKLCGTDIVKNKLSLSINDFIKSANIVHNNKYNYNLVEYKNNKNNVRIICPIHGEFMQTPNNHLAGQGCSKCGNLLAGIKQRNDTSYFIGKSKEIHGNKYNYSNVNYITVHDYVDIICPIHGKFTQKPNTHLNGSGCPYCKESIGEKKIAKYLENKLIKFERQKKMFGCKNINKLVFDFFLPDHNTLIEFDGEQHFIPIKHFGGINKFKKQKINDKIKNDYVKSNNYNLLRIKFNKINMIDKILDNYEPISQR